MRVSIIAVDNVVSIDGETHCASCEELIAQDIHAVQWHEDLSLIHISEPTRRS